MAHPRFVTLAACLLVAAIGCSPKPAAPAGEAGTFKPIDPAKAVLWDRQTTETAKLLREFVAEFNKDRQGMPLDPQYIGGYSEIFRKVTASIEAGTLPAMAASYESMASEYIRAGALAELDSFVNDPKLGYTKEELEDFFPVVLEINRYPEFGNRMYSFPYTKSVLMLGYNERVMQAAGLDGTPPKTWDEFLAQCRQITARTGKPAYAINVDASAVDGMIFSMGGEVVDGKTTLFDQPASIRTFELIETLAKEKLCKQITPGTYDDESEFAQGNIAFFIRSSISRVSVLRVMGTTEGWGLAMLPQADPANPRTVLFGANVCIFNVPKEQQTAAWEFVKFFTSPEVNVRWALGTGYVPIRKSAANDPRIQAFWAEWKSNRAAYDCLPFARSEPKLAGWQKVRTLIEKAETSVLTGLQTGRDAALQLKREADAALK